MKPNWNWNGFKTENQHINDGFNGTSYREFMDGEPEKIDPSGRPTESKPLDTQVGGNHYKNMKIQPIEYIYSNNIPYLEGNIIKYISRWRNKNGVTDLEKAKHYLDILIEYEKSTSKV